MSALSLPFWLLPSLKDQSWDACRTYTSTNLAGHSKKVKLHCSRLVCLLFCQQRTALQVRSEVRESARVHVSAQRWALCALRLVARWTRSTKRLRKGGLYYQIPFETTYVRSFLGKASPSNLSRAFAQAPATCRLRRSERKARSVAPAAAAAAAPAPAPAPAPAQQPEQEQERALKR